MKALDLLKRRNRYTRQPYDERITITDADVEEIFLPLLRYRTLRASHLAALRTKRKNATRFIKRLGRLYHGNYRCNHVGDHTDKCSSVWYLERPDGQFESFNALYKTAVYQLSDAGERLLIERCLVEPKSPFLHRGKGKGVMFHHDLMVADILASIEIGIRARPDLRFISWQEILAASPQETRSADHPFSIPVSISYEMGKNRFLECHKPLEADALFGIEYRDGDRVGHRYFALEADRESEPLWRKDFEESSFLRKLLQYRAIMKERIYKTRFGFPNLYVLTVTTSPDRTKAIMDSLAEIMGTNSFFLFKTMPTLKSLEKAPPATGFVLTEPWQCVGHEDIYIDQGGSNARRADNAGKGAGIEARGN
jgi:hypothetical protein